MTTVTGLDRETVILLHGTFARPYNVDPGDPATAMDSTEWWHPGSSFCVELDAQLAALQSTARCWAHAPEYDVFQWSGDNTWIARETAAIALAAHLERLLQDNWICHVVAHSHGGNVLLDAVARIERRFPPLQYWDAGNLVTLGTPFVESEGTVTQEERDVMPTMQTTFALLTGWIVLLGALVFSLPRGFDAPRAPYSILLWLAAIFVALLPILGKLLQAMMTVFAVMGTTSYLISRRLLVLNAESDEAFHVLDKSARFSRESVNRTRRTVSKAQYWESMRAMIARVDSTLLPRGVIGLERIIGVVLATAAGGLLTLWVGSADARNVASVLLVIDCAFLLGCSVGFPKTTSRVLGLVFRLITATRLIVMSLAGQLVSSILNRRAFQFIYEKALGLDGYPFRKVAVKLEPGSVLRGFYTFEPLDAVIVAGANSALRTSAGDAAQRLLDALQAPDLSLADISPLLRMIASDARLVHSVYFRDAHILKRIAGWLSVSTKQHHEAWTLEHADDDF